MMSKDEKKRTVVVLVLFFLVFFILVNLIVVNQIANPRYQRSLQINVESEKEFLREMLLWPSIVKSSHIGNWSLGDMNSFDFRYFQDCWYSDDWLRLYADPYCTYLWMRVLNHSNITSLDLILAVITNDERDQGVEAKHNQNGGMRCMLDNVVDAKGYWKPCTPKNLPQNSESFISEIIAFYIDRILGFNRTPIVVPRTFSKYDFNVLANEAMTRENDRDEHADEKLDSVLERCGSRDHLHSDGALVGWANTMIETLDSDHPMTKKLLVDMFKIQSEESFDRKLHKFNITVSSTDEEKAHALENVAVNMFAFLVGNKYKFRHSVFIMARENLAGKKEYGPFAYIDNDRSNFEKNTFKKPEFLNHPLKEFCIFPKEIATRILLLSSKKSEGISLGKIVKDCAKSTPHNLPFSNKAMRRLDERVDFLADAILQCSHKHGVENVLFDEPWNTHYDNIVLFSSLLSKL